ncbi:MAG: stage V sporulation protein AA [Lachnospiraceae bacterium]|nr:stage V sporulation protein AA [Lachnospiraceae bacterium]
MSDTLYLKMEKSAEVTEQKVRVSDIASVWCKNIGIMEKFASMNVMDEKPETGQRYIVTAIKIIEMAEKKFPTVEISNIGETECVVEIKKRQKPHGLFEFIKVVFICFILFCGAGFSIMSFNNDVDVESLFANIARSTVADENLGEQIIKLFYALGIFVGITVFYNHFGARKLSKDPTPIEVEMRDYEESINKALIEGRQRNDRRMDVK